MDRIKFVEKQKRMTKAMHGNGVPFHYICIFKILCLSRNEDFSTEKISNTILSLPLYPDLTRSEMNYITNSVTEFFELCE